MPFRSHWHLFCLATTWWTLFFIAGLPTDYYQTMPVAIVVVFGVLAPTWALAAYMRTRCRKSPAHPWRQAGWIAFYMTVPLFVYDGMFLAHYQQRGASFLVSHWYLTVFYVIPWIVAPVVARSVEATATAAR